MMKRVLLVVFALTMAVALEARVISYAPYSDHTSYPAHQSRTNRHFVTFEAASASNTNPQLPTFGQLVLYDFLGIEEPRVVFPQDGSNAVFTAAALREDDNGTPVIFAQAASGPNVYASWLSVDGGTTWRTLDLPASPIAQLAVTGTDNGGPFASYRYSQVRIGTAEFPFVVATGNSVYAIGAGATTKLLYEQTAPNPPQLALAGRDRTGSQFLLRTNTRLATIDLNGSLRTLYSSFISPQPSMEGFITTDGAAYVEERATNGNAGKLWYVKDGTKKELFNATWTDLTTPTVYAVPTFDYAGAWIVVRGGGRPTVLYRHSGGNLEKMFEDITAPDVEAIHTGSSGTRLLIQVHRPRPGVDLRSFRDPALAVWQIGDIAPRAYDELFMSEQWNKGFVHVDVEKIGGGEPFVFDSGAAPQASGGGIIVSPPPPTSGGSDVVQEWGIVRASLRQQLVLPTVGRTAGAFGSNWVSDVTFQNPLDAPQQVELRFVPSGQSMPPQSRTLILNPLEIRMVKDVVGSLFQIDSAIGALFITPAEGVTVTSRTYSQSNGGTYGFGMNAIDVLAAAASPRFPVTFAGAFPGGNFRTNLTLTDTSGRGTEAVLNADGNQGDFGISGVSLTAGPNGHQQFNFINNSLGVQPYETGALRVTPKRGTAVTAVFTIDNLTNDSTYFAPDVPAGTLTRMIPAIGHLDGANGSRFRSDLYLFNPSNQVRGIMLEAKAWDTNESPAFLSLTLLPNEARIIRDVLATAFGKTGIARLRFTSQSFDNSGIRVTSRTYSVDGNGGTYGFLMPPLNNFQIAGSGDTLEILGAFGDAGYRTNIGLVELTEFPPNRTATATVEILDSSSKRIDLFSVSFPVAGGMQLNDIFRARGLTASGPMLIRVTPTNGTIGAYATTTDNVTNDSSYLAANLAAKQ